MHRHIYNACILLGWALMNGLARTVIEVIKGPIETKIIEEAKPPPPPPGPPRARPPGARCGVYWAT